MVAHSASLAVAAKDPDAVLDERVSRAFVPRLSHVWAGLAVLAAALACALQPLEPIDYWWGVRLGGLIHGLGSIPTDDPLSYTPVRGPIVDGQWLARVVFSVLHDLGGVPLNLALRTVVAVATVLLLIRICRESGAGPRLSAVVAGLAGILFVPGLAVRPQLFAVVPFLLVWMAARRPPKGLVGVGLAALTVALWGNLHGSFILAYPLLAVGVLDAAVERLRTGASDRLHPAIVLAVCCGLAPLLNPYGFGLASYVGDAILFNGGGTSVGVLGVEWGAPAIRTAYGALFYGSLLLTMLLIGAGSRPRFAEGLLLLGFGVLAISSIRHILWWSLILAPFVARALQERTADLARWKLPVAGPLPDGSPMLNAICLVLFGVLSVSMLPWWREGLPLPPNRTALLDPETPIAVGEYLAAHPQPGRLFNETDWSAYLSWRLPEQRVYVDNRFELHPAAVWEEYTTISRGHVSWERRLDAWGVTRLALSRATQPGLIQAVQESADWRLVYEDDRALVYDRANRPTSSLP